MNLQFIINLLINQLLIHLVIKLIRNTKNKKLLKFVLLGYKELPQAAFPIKLKVNLLKETLKQCNYKT